MVSNGYTLFLYIMLLTSVFLEEYMMMLTCDVLGCSYTVELFSKWTLPHYYKLLPETFLFHRFF